MISEEVSQVIAMCHHRALSPKAMLPSTTTPPTAEPANAPAMRRGVAPRQNCNGDQDD